MNRRGILGGLAALMTNKPKVEDLAKIDMTGLDYGIPTPSLVSGGSILHNTIAGPNGSWNKARLAQIELLKLLNPDWFERKRRLSTRNVGRIDPDIAVHRSWSLAAKIAAQRERNYQRELAQETEWLQVNIAEEMFGGNG